MSERLERKYRLRHAAREYLLAYWRPYLVRAPYTNHDGVYPILSQYFDSPALTFYHEKHAGIGLRRKVRLRAYGYRFTEGGTCFLEIKRRTHEAVGKLRVPLPGFERRFLSPAGWRALALPALDPFCALAETHLLRPSAQVLYLREAYEGIIDPGLRITFDSALTGFHPGEEVTREVLYDRSRALLPETETILEVKNGGALPAWVRRGIEWTEITQEPIPKYVLAVDALNLVALKTGVFA